MLKTFDETYAEYKRLFAKIDEADSIRGKNELFRQLTALLSKMEHGIDTDPVRNNHSDSTTFM